MTGRAFANVLGRALLFANRLDIASLDTRNFCISGVIYQRTAVRRAPFMGARIQVSYGYFVRDRQYVLGKYSRNVVATGR
jgi:hypothetical protein